MSIWETTSRYFHDRDRIVNILTGEVMEVRVVDKKSYTPDPKPVKKPKKISGKKKPG